MGQDDPYLSNANLRDSERISQGQVRGNLESKRTSYKTLDCVREGTNLKEYQSFMQDVNDMPQSTLFNIRIKTANRTATAAESKKRVKSSFDVKRYSQ